MPIRILIADDHAVVRQGLKMFLGLDEDFDVIGEATNGAEAVELARSLLEVRKRAIVPLLATIQDSAVSFDDGVLSGRWRAGPKTLKLLANLSDVGVRRDEMNWCEPIWGGKPPSELPPWSVYAAIGDA